MESKFTGGLWGLIWRRVVYTLLGIITLGIATPWIICKWQRWYAENTYIDGYQLEFDGTGWQLLGREILWGFLTVITLTVYAWWVPIKYQQWLTKHTHFA